uniref:Nuclear protein MDM1 n=2 Tax=Nothobranchius korthausae TaxID=1143690 RepID=A0A1A8FRI9_9TELE
MTVRFKCQSEYQKSFSVPRSRSVSPQRCVPSAGLDSNQMGICREPGLQRRKRPGSLGAARSCSSRFCHDPAVIAARRAPTAASRNMKERSPNAKAPLPPGSPAVLDTPVGPRPAADTRTPGTPDSEWAVRPATGAGSGKPRPSEPGSQSQRSRTVTGEAPTEQQQPSADQVDLTLTRNVGLRSRGQRSEYSRKFGWKKPAPAASPLLTAEQVLFSNNRSVPPSKIHPVSMETEYKESFRGLAQPTGPHPWKRVEHQRLPPFHKELAHSRKEAEHTKDKTQNINNRALSPPRTMPPPPQVYKRCRNPEGGGATDDFTQQVRELRQQAQLYRHRAWGTNFCRNHLSQLLSEHTAAWEPTDTTDSTPHLNDDFSPEPDSCSTSCVEALDLASNFSRKSSADGSGETKASTASPGDQHTAWEEEQDEEKGNTDEEEGRLPTPRLKPKPVQRTHHDLTTPATGGAVLVGKLKSTDDFSPNKQLISGTVTMTTGAENPHRLTKHKEAWSENKATYSSPSPKHEPAFHPHSKPMRMKQAAPPIPTSSPQHVIQGTLRHPDFQHNGELGLQFLPFPRGGCSADEGEPLSHDCEAPFKLITWHEICLFGSQTIVSQCCRGSQQLPALQHPPSWSALRRDGRASGGKDDLTCVVVV